MLIRNSDPVICTFTGKYVSPLDLKVADIDIRDIAHALSNQARFSGHTREFYSVAQHSVLVAGLLHAESIEVQFAGLMHDAAEAYLQDVARPLKEDAYFGKAYRGAEARAEKVIAEAFGIEVPHPQIVKIADVRMLAAERRDLLPPEGDWDILHGVEAPEATVNPWSPKRSRWVFLQKFETLSRQRTKEVAA